MKRNHQAVISASGRYLEFYVGGERWMAWPIVGTEGDGWWAALGPDGIAGQGFFILDAVDDARNPRPIEARP